MLRYVAAIALVAGLLATTGTATAGLAPDEAPAPEVDAAEDAPQPGLKDCYAWVTPTWERTIFDVYYPWIDDFGAYCDTSARPPTLP
jgi:hypothetical protein